MILSNTVKLNTSFACCFIVSVSRFCPRLPQAFCLWTPPIPRHPENSTLPTPLDSRITACHWVPWVILTLIEGSAAAKSWKTLAYAYHKYAPVFRRPVLFSVMFPHNTELGPVFIDPLKTIDISLIQQSFEPRTKTFLFLFLRTH